MKRLRIILSGMIAADPHQGGASWAVLQYLLGLRALGHRVTFIEPVERAALLPAGTTLDGSQNAKYFRDVMRAHQCGDTAALLVAGSRETIGCDYPRLCQLAADADVLFNISGLLTDESLLGAIPTRVYVDLDPAFNQLWHAVEGVDRHFGGHTHFVTIGQSIGEPECQVPTCGLAWIKTLQPVVLEHWPILEAGAAEFLTTIGNWRGYGSIEWNGVFYGQKAHAFREFMTLPMRARERFHVALAIHRDETRDLAALASNRWVLLDPKQVAGTPASYQQFIQNSKAEIGIAKTGYVKSRCGWFSDRSACYLASGRPVLAHDTGFCGVLPVGDGLFAFNTMDDVLAGIDAINSDYPHHSRAGRALAEDFFESSKVLTRVLDQIAVGP